MYALLFVAVAALALGVAQLLGWTKDSRDSRDWQPTGEQPSTRVRKPRSLPISVPTDAVILTNRTEQPRRVS